jgi:hypothetical protein
VAVYSTRFVVVPSGAGDVAYTIPAGKLAVVKMMSAYNNSGSTAQLRLFMAGTAIWGASVPGSSGVFGSGLHLVGYAGELIEVTWNATSGAAYAGGYLLDALR